MIGSSRDYQTLFQVGGMPYLISDIFCRYYRSLQCLLIFQNNIWTSFLPKTVIKATLAEGSSLFGDRARFEEYKRTFEEYKSETKLFFEKALQTELSRDQMEVFLADASRLFEFYSKTEFFYTDQAYLSSKDNLVMQENLKELGDIKNAGREYLNKIFYGMDAYLNRYLEKVGKRFDRSSDDLIQYSWEELLSLFDGKLVSEAQLDDRRQSYVFFSPDGVTKTRIGQQAADLATSFLNKSEVDQSELKGISANKGCVRGKVKVIFSGYDNFDVLKHAIEAMNQGDVLVAETTSPELLTACHKAAAIITNQGGLLSHAAIISREMGIPCIVGTGNATRVLKDNDEVEVDANNGVVRILES